MPEFLLGGHDDVSVNVNDVEFKFVFLPGFTNCTNRQKETVARLLSDILDGWDFDKKKYMYISIERGADSSIGRDEERPVPGATQLQTLSITAVLEAVKLVSVHLPKFPLGLAFLTIVLVDDPADGTCVVQGTARDWCRAAEDMESILASSFRPTAYFFWGDECQVMGESNNSALNVFFQSIARALKGIPRHPNELEERQLNFCFRGRFVTETLPSLSVPTITEISSAATFRIFTETEIPDCVRSAQFGDNWFGLMPAPDISPQKMRPLFQSLLRMVDMNQTIRRLDLSDCCTSYDDMLDIMELVAKSGITHVQSKFPKEKYQAPTDTDIKNWHGLWKENYTLVSNGLGWRDPPLYYKLVAMYANLNAAGRKKLVGPNANATPTDWINVLSNRGINQDLSSLFCLLSTKPGDLFVTNQSPHWDIEPTSNKRKGEP